MKLTSLFVGLALVVPVFAQEAPGVKIVVPAQAKAGSTVKGTLTMRFADGWHGYQNPPLDQYQNPVSVSLATKGWKLQKVAYPEGIVKEVAGAKAAVYEGEIKVPFEVVIPKKVGKSTLEFVVAFQQCNDSTCLPPGSVTIKLPINVTKK